MPMACFFKVHYKYALCYFILEFLPLNKASFSLEIVVLKNGRVKAAKDLFYVCISMYYALFIFLFYLNNLVNKFNSDYYSFCCFYCGFIFLLVISE